MVNHPNRSRAQPDEHPITLNVVAYSLAVDDPAYHALVAKLQTRNLHRFNVWHNLTGKEKSAPSGTYTVETEHLFGNQTNTVEGFRIFDWYDGMSAPSRSWRTGHYVEDDAGFAALQALRRATVRCAYCGFQRPAAGAPALHEGCLSSAYLKESELHLTQFVLVAEGLRAGLPPLTDDERAALQPLYREAQIHGNDQRSRERIAKQRAALRHDFETKMANAKAEFDGFTWLMDRGINTDNAIFYAHTGKFGFGWRTPLGADIAKKLEQELVGFPCAFEIETA